MTLLWCDVSCLISLYVMTMWWCDVSCRISLYVMTMWWDISWYSIVCNDHIMAWHFLIQRCMWWPCDDLTFHGVTILQLQYSIPWINFWKHDVLLKMYAENHNDMWEIHTNIFLCICRKCVVFNTNFFIFGKSVLVSIIVYDSILEKFRCSGWFCWVLLRSYCGRTSEPTFQ